MDWKLIQKLVDQAQAPIESEPWLESLNPNGEPYWRFLFWLAHVGKMERAVVIGTWRGEDVAHIARAGTQVWGIDINRDDHWHDIEQGCPNANFIIGDSRTIELPSEIVDVDMVFQDSSHHYQTSIAEWERFRPMLRPGGIWVCDDITPAFWDEDVDPPNKGMVEYFQSRPGPKRTFHNLHKGSVIGVILA